MSPARPERPWVSDMLTTLPRASLMAALSSSAPSICSFWLRRSCTCLGARLSELLIDGLFLSLEVSDAFGDVGSGGLELLRFALSRLLALGSCLLLLVGSEEGALGLAGLEGVGGDLLCIGDGLVAIESVAGLADLFGWGRGKSGSKRMTALRWERTS